MAVVVATGITWVLSSALKHSCETSSLLPSPSPSPSLPVTVPAFILPSDRLHCTTADVTFSSAGQPIQTRCSTVSLGPQTAKDALSHDATNKALSDDASLSLQPQPAGPRVWRCKICSVAIMTLCLGVRRDELNPFKRPHLHPPPMYCA